MAKRDQLTANLVLLILMLTVTNDSMETTICNKADACYTSLMNDEHTTLTSQDSAKNENACATFEQCVFDTEKQTDDIATADSNTTHSNTVSQTLSEFICTCSLINNRFLLEETSSSLCKINQTTDQFNNVKACKRHAHLCLMISEYKFDNISDHTPTYCSLLLQCVSNTTIDLDRLRQIMVFPRPQNVEEDCPYNDFCLIRSRYEHRINRCSSCSCDYDCGKTRSCCEEDLDTYHIAEDPTMACHKLTLSHGETSLYVVSTCEYGSSCNNTIVAPTSSLKTNRIYINADCAICNCVQNYTVWESGISCSTTLQNKHMLTDIRLTSSCSDFISPPDDHSDLVKRLGCPDSLINECKENRVRFYLQPDCKRAWAPLFATALPGKIYRNPHCAKCNFDILSPLLRADKESNNFLVILNLDVLKPYRTRQRTGERCIPHQGVCRQVLCPEATVRLDLTCEYIFKQWRGVTLSVQLRLRPLVHNHTLTLSNLAEISQPELHKWVHPKCGFRFPQSGNTVYVYMRQFDSDAKIFVRQIQILAVYLKKNIDPREFITTLKACLQNNWEIKLNGTTYSYTVQLAGSANINHKEEMSKLTLDDPSNTTGEPTEPFSDIYEKLVNTTMDDPIDLFVTKLFFCEQIRLASFEVKQDGGHIVLLHNQKRLGKGEYKLIQTDGVVKEFYVIVCIEDFLYGVKSNRAHAQLYSASLIIVLSGLVTFVKTDASFASN